MRKTVSLALSCAALFLFLGPAMVVPANGQRPVENSGNRFERYRDNAARNEIFGWWLMEMRPEMRYATGLSFGLHVFDLHANSIAGRAGILKNEVITKINSEEVSQVRDVRAAVESAKQRGQSKVQVEVFNPANRTTRRIDVEVPRGPQEAARAAPAAQSQPSLPDEFVNLVIVADVTALVCSGNPIKRDKIEALIKEFNLSREEATQHSRYRFRMLEIRTARSTSAFYSDDATCRTTIVGVRQGDYGPKAIEALTMR